MSDNPVLQPGDEGEWVTYLQQMLEQAGYSPGAVDGSFGSTTEDAVRACQEANGLTVDGIVGAQTWAALTGAGTESTETAATEQPQGDVPPEFVAAGAPASLDQWTDEQKQGYFVGKEPLEEVGGDTPDNVEVLAMADTGASEGEAIA